MLDYIFLIMYKNWNGAKTGRMCEYARMKRNSGACVVRVCVFAWVRPNHGRPFADCDVRFSSFIFVRST